MTFLCHDLTLNVIVHVLLLWVILTVFFILVVSKLESKTLKTEINELIGKKTTDLCNRVQSKHPDFKHNLEMLPLQSALQLWSKDTEVSNITNDWVLHSTIPPIIILFAILLTIYYATNKGFNLSYILKRNLIIFICVGVIEVLFFFFIARKFVPVKPSFFVETILQQNLFKNANVY